MNQNEQYTVCIAAFRPPLDGTQHELDFLLGDIFMRNVYSVYVPCPVVSRSVLITAPALSQLQLWQHLNDTRRPQRRRERRLYPIPLPHEPRSGVLRVCRAAQDGAEDVATTI